MPISCWKKLDSAQALAIAPDGKIVVAGVTETAAASDNFNIAAARYFGATARGETLLAATVKTLSNIWITPNNNAAKSVQVPSSSEAAVISWTPDDKFLYASKGDFNIWMMNADGSNQMQLTKNQGTNNHPSMTPDGRYIVFSSSRESPGHIYRMDADGRNQIRLTTGLGEWLPRLSPDGKWIYYIARTGWNDRLSIGKVPIEGGEPVFIKEVPNYTNLAVSPRDELIAYILETEEEGRSVRVVEVLKSDGTLVKTIKLPVTARVESPELDARRSRHRLRRFQKQQYEHLDDRSRRPKRGETSYKFH